jgi:hypothetical protein
MGAKIFSKIQTKAELAGIQPRTKKSRDWFINNLKNIKNLSRSSLLTDDSLVRRNRPLIGRMFMFMYDPKFKETLPYYDQFPLIVMVGPAPKGFYGLNLHYLHPRARAVFFDELMEHMNNDKLNDTTRFRLTYEMLKSVGKLRMFQPCFKRYLFKHMTSKTVEVPPSEWEVALFLPTDNFAKESRNAIWNKSKAMFR